MASFLQALMSIALFLIVPIILLFSLIKRFRPKLPYPPGPKGLPIIGNMLMMDQLTHHGLADLAKKYGGLMHLRMGSLHMVAVSDKEVARQVLQVHDNVFSNRPATIAISYLTYDRADMAFAHNNPFWRQMRKLSVMKLFSRRRAESWDSVRDEVESTIRKVASNTGTSVNIGELVFGLMTDIIYRAAFGATAQQGKEEFMKILQEFSRLFGAFNIADFIPCLSSIDPQGIKKRVVKARQSLDHFIDDIIDDHMQKKMVSNGSDNIDTDMVDELLAFYNEEEKVSKLDDDQNAIVLTKDNIKAMIMDVMFGGTETVASTIEWTISELMKSPEDLKRVQQELADVVGFERRVEEHDLEKLIFLKCCLKETLRLHPAIPLTLHETAKDVEVCGYFIPMKTRVMINAWAIGRDENSWEDPHSFKPSRFLKEGAPDFKGSSFEFIPFGSGRRSCPGMQLGLFALEMAVAHLLHCFTWDLPDAMKPSELDMTDLFGLSAPRATRLVAVPTKRVICPLV